MSPYYELAYALASKSLCFFVGTGFSKYLTSGAAPSWTQLLMKCCENLSDKSKLLDELFPNEKNTLPLEECASIISLQMKKEGKNIHSEIASEILKLESNKAIAKPILEFSKKHNNLKFITTNYDHLIENDILEGKHTTFCPGYPINRQRSHHEIYHIHGAAKYPQHMVVTADDYYRFINFPSYFSKRLDTLLEENTTIIIGYSLGDINLKSILNSHRYRNSHAINRQHLFFLSRRKILQHIKDYYDASYGLRVIEETDIPQLIFKIDKKFDQIKGEVVESLETLTSILNKTHMYTDDYLKRRESFASILATISSNGIIITHPTVIGLLKDTIQRKHTFSRQDGAWSQYDQLADWLIQLGCVMDLENTPLQETYLSAVLTSFTSMSKKKIKGMSWDAYNTWSAGWSDLTFKNRTLIRTFIRSSGHSGDFDTFIDV